MQVRDLAEMLQQFDPKSTVQFEVNNRDVTGHAWVDVRKEADFKRGPDTCRIIVEVS